MNNYINDKIFGLPTPLKKGGNTSPTSYRKDKGYIFKVDIRGYKYYKVHVKRQNVSKIKYFKKFKEAKLFVSILRENKYL